MLPQQAPTKQEQLFSYRKLYQKPHHPGESGVSGVRRRRPKASSLRCGKLSARSRRSGLRFRAEDNKLSLACHASAHITGCVHSASYACKPSRPHSRHFPPLHSHHPNPPRIPQPPFLRTAAKVPRFPFISLASFGGQNF